MDDPEPKLRHPPFCLFVHRRCLLQGFGAPLAETTRRSDAKTRWGRTQRRNGAHCSVMIRRDRQNRPMSSSERAQRVLRPEQNRRRLRCQYCCACRLTDRSHRFPAIFSRSADTMTSARYRSARMNASGRKVCTARQSGHRNRFTHRGRPNPSKYRSTKPCPHSRELPQPGHRGGLGQSY